jgi:hypothetical protein
MRCWENNRRSEQQSAGKIQSSYGRCTYSSVLEYGRHPFSEKTIASLTVHFAGMKTILQSAFSTVSLCEGNYE